MKKLLYTFDARPESKIRLAHRKTERSGSLSTEVKMKIRIAGNQNLIDLNDIVYLKSAKNYTVFKLLDGSEIISSKTLGIFEEELKEVLNFVRPHRSYIVNFDHIGELRFNCRGGEIYLDEEIIEISRRKAAEFRRNYRKFLAANGKNYTRSHLFKN